MWGISQVQVQSWAGWVLRPGAPVPATLGLQFAASLGLRAAQHPTTVFGFVSSSLMRRGALPWPWLLAVRLVCNPLFLKLYPRV